MINLLSIILVATVFILTGQYYNCRMRKRILSLNNYIFLVESINSHIMYSQKDIIQIINELTCSGDIDLIAMHELNKENVMDFDESWKKAIVTVADGVPVPTVTD